MLTETLCHEVRVSINAIGREIRTRAPIITGAGEKKFGCIGGFEDSTARLPGQTREPQLKESCAKAVTFVA